MIFLNYIFLGLWSLVTPAGDLQVADCGTREFTDQKRIEMTVSEFVDHWLCLSSANNGGNSDSGAAARSLLYLKDWHFVKVSTLDPPCINLSIS